MQFSIFLITPKLAVATQRLLVDVDVRHIVVRIAEDAVYDFIGVIRMQLIEINLMVRNILTLQQLLRLSAIDTAI